MLMHTQDMFPFKRKRNLHRNIQRFYKKYNIYTRKVNEFKEVEDDVFVREVNGFYYYNTTSIDRRVDSYGKFVIGRGHYIQVSDIDKIEAGMYTVIDGKRYEIIDVENEAGLSISYILTLEDKMLHAKNKGVK